jgi:phage host-nuclease inhibitor protein Gam
MTKKIKSIADIESPEQREIAVAVANYALKAAALTQGNVSLNQDLVETRDRHEAELKTLKPERDSALSEVQKLAEANRKKLFTRAKCLRTSFGIVGFRKKRMTFSLKPGETTEKVLQRLKQRRPDLVVTKEVVSKNRLYAARNDEGFRELMDEVGILINDDENFYIKLND